MVLVLDGQGFQHIGRIESQVGVLGGQRGHFSANGIIGLVEVGAGQILGIVAGVGHEREWVEVVGLGLLQVVLESGALLLLHGLLPALPFRFGGSIGVQRGNALATQRPLDQVIQLSGVAVLAQEAVFLGGLHQLVQVLGAGAEHRAVAGDESLALLDRAGRKLVGHVAVDAIGAQESQERVAIP